MADILRGDTRFETLVQILEAASATSGPPDAQTRHGSHTVPSLLPSATISGAVAVTSSSEGIIFGGARVVERDIQASNGIVHVLDAVNLTRP